MGEKGITINCGWENKMKGKYKIFTLIPSLIFVHDSQYKNGFGDGIDGSMEYSIFIDFLAWSFNITLDVPNKKPK